jgi:hypothetical protein
MHRIVIIFLLIICRTFADCQSNIQDVPLVNFDCSPLKDWAAFAVSPIYSFQGAYGSKINEKAVALIKRKLVKRGKVIELEAPDVMGLATSANVLTLTLQEVETYDKKPLNCIRMSLTLQTMTVINKTKQECASYIWTSNEFVQGKIEEGNERSIIQSIDKLFQNFIDCYQATPSNQKLSPVFYLYK